MNDINPAPELSNTLQVKPGTQAAPPPPSWPKWAYNALRQIAVAVLGTVYTWRVVLLLAGAIAGIAYSHNASMVSGFFALKHWDQFWLSFVLTIISMQIFVLLRILQLHSPARFGFRPDDVSPFPEEFRAVFPAVVAILLAGAPLGLFIYELEGLPNRDETKIALGICAGLIVCAACILLENWLGAAGSEQLLAIPRLRDNLQPPDWFNPISRFVCRRFCTAVHVIDESGAGFIKEGRVLSGHILALFMGLALLAMYFGAFITASLLPALPLGPGHVKAVFYALLTLSLVASVLSFVCFVLDRHRIPTITLVASVWFLICLRANAEHYYEVFPINTAPRVAASAIWKGSNPGVVIVSAEGGGIQAEAWMTRVMAGIVSQLPVDLQSKFVNSIRLLSGVSGGSIGVMMFQTLYQNQQMTMTPLAHLRKVHTAGVCSTALSWLGYGLVYYDVTRPLLTIYGASLSDRGASAERAWRKLLSNGLGTQADVTMNALRKGVVQAKFPLLVFNATIADRGTPLLFTNFDLPRNSQNDFRSFNELYPNRDVALTTAARLSAAFPWVSPSPRPYENRAPMSGAQGNNYAIMDGGFYDNFGFAGAYYTLEAATDNFHNKAPRPVLWIQVRLPASADQTTDSLASSAAGPLIALENTRETGQRSRADQLAELARNRLKDELEVVPFDYPIQNSPLSWALTDKQIHDIDRGWATMTNGYQNIRAVCMFLGGSGEQCESSAAPWRANQRAASTEVKAFASTFDPNVCPEDIPTQE